MIVNVSLTNIWSSLFLPRRRSRQPDSSSSSRPLDSTPLAATRSNRALCRSEHTHSHTHVSTRRCTSPVLLCQNLYNIKPLATAASPSPTCHVNCTAWYRRILFPFPSLFLSLSLAVCRSLSVSACAIVSVCMCVNKAFVVIGPASCFQSWIPQ